MNFIIPQGRGERARLWISGLEITESIFSTSRRSLDAAKMGKVLLNPKASALLEEITRIKNTNFALTSPLTALE
jgi:vacuolar-type H+-ATPase subunit D/Vma8